MTIAVNNTVYGVLKIQEMNSEHWNRQQASIDHIHSTSITKEKTNFSRLCLNVHNHEHFDQDHILLFRTIVSVNIQNK